jgi:small conductance mechanosensitive channel
MEVFTESCQGLLRSYGPNLVSGVAILLIGWFLSKYLTRGARRLMAGAGVDSTLVGFAANLLYICLLAVVVIAALERFGVPTMSFLGVVGAAGLAVGLALKNTLSDFAAGVMLITFRPFKVGDRIEAAGVEGVVQEIQVFATTIRATDNRKVIIPNAAVTGGKIANYSS